MLIVILLCLSVGVYAGYTLSAQEVTYTKPDGTQVTVKEALDELRTKTTTDATAATTITEVQSDSMLTKMVNSTILDESGNKIKEIYYRYSEDEYLAYQTTTYEYEIITVEE